jgi:hypothetical protein
MTLAGAVKHASTLKGGNIGLNSASIADQDLAYV